MTLRELLTNAQKEVDEVLALGFEGVFEAGFGEDLIPVNEFLLKDVPTLKVGGYGGDKKRLDYSFTLFRHGTFWLSSGGLWYNSLTERVPESIYPRLLPPLRLKESIKAIFFAMLVRSQDRVVDLSNQVEILTRDIDELEKDTIPLLKNKIALLEAK